MTASVHRLHLGDVKLSGTYNPPTFEDTRIDVFAFLVKSEDHVILIDTGIGDDNEFIEATFQPNRRSIEHELSRYDVAPENITHIVNSHLHFDHCGNNRLFPQAKCLVQADELAVASSENYTVRAWFDFQGARLEVLDGDHQLTPDVSIVKTPGHTPGHQSVIVNTAAGPEIIAAQVALNTEEYLAGGYPQSQSHQGFEDVYCDTIRKLKSTPAVSVLFSHDGTELQQLS
ncbi:MAG: N-acyl homoserine lactonase family protein [Henriciella sp.]|nr:N-acyl homoserine lactonase family protein [Henriciella sp.]